MRLTDTLAVQPDGWTLVETGWDAERAIAVGSNFLCGNGYLGYRGTTAEQRAADYVALVVSDTYDCADGKWRELTSVPNPLFVAARVGRTPLSVGRGESIEARLDMRSGVFTASFTQQIEGVAVTVEVDRFASYDELHLLAQRWTVVADGDLDVGIDAGIDADIWSLNGVHLPQVYFSTEHSEQHLATATTVESGVTVAVASS